jgi:sugar phosphate isomerase/epimerase
MKYGAMNFPIKPVADELADIAALGFDYLELSMDPPRAHYSTIRQQMSSILSTLASQSMNIISHLPTFVSTPSSNLCFHRRPDRQHPRSIAAGNV